MAAEARQTYLAEDSHENYDPAAAAWPYHRRSRVAGVAADSTANAAGHAADVSCDPAHPTLATDPADAAGDPAGSTGDSAGSANDTAWRDEPGRAGRPAELIPGSTGQPSTPDHDRPAGKGHLVARHKLLSFSRLDSSVQEHQALADGLLGLSSAFRQASEFQELAELDRHFRHGYGPGLA